MDINEAVLTVIAELRVHLAEADAGFAAVSAKRDELHDVIATRDQRIAELESLVARHVPKVTG